METNDIDSDATTFDEYGLDERLLKGIALCGWPRPTLVQAKFIPLALEGKDIITRARTGSGKTGAYLIPIIHKLLTAKIGGETSTSTQCLIVAPTRELCRQIVLHAQQLCKSCTRDVRIVDMAHYDNFETISALIADSPDIVVGTPTRLLVAINDRPTFFSDIHYVVIDEADLLFSFGYHDDTLKLFGLLPNERQTFLTSATMSSDVKSIKHVLFRQQDSDGKYHTSRNLVTLKLNDCVLPKANQLAQFHINCTEEDKFVLLYALLKLKLIRGKSILFVRNTNRCYRLKLFLEQFGIYSCVLNAEMPVNSRCHIVQQFNEGEYQYIIASDACELDEGPSNEPEPEVDEDKQEDVVDDEPSAKRERKDAGGGRWKRKRNVDRESGVGRGIDFQRVANVINFDFPPNVDTYIHRVGRTARGWSRGTALSFTVADNMSDVGTLAEVRQMLIEQMGDDILKPYQFRMDELDGFRYRARDVLRAVTSTRVREARLAEIRNELLQSKKLDSFFATNPREMNALRHDKQTKAIKRQAHLVDVPQYIVPAPLKGNDYSIPAHHIRKSAGTSKVNAKTKYGQKRNAAKVAKAKDETQKMETRGQKKFAKKQNDPLQNFDCLK